MALEIERKYLVNLDTLTATQGELSDGTAIKQAYIATADNTVVRIRVAGTKAFITLKGENNGLTRTEFEYPIPLTDAEEMIEQLCLGPIIDKTRYLIPIAGHTWELDIFHGDNLGLVVAEIELSCEDEAFERPDWVTREVSHESRYYNSSLIDKPYSTWSATQKS